MHPDEVKGHCLLTPQHSLPIQTTLSTVTGLVTFQQCFLYKEALPMIISHIRKDECSLIPACEKTGYSLVS